jgi:catechol-2,3-dioxygenase
MLPIRGVYEVAIRVKDLGRAEAFYRQVLGLAVGLHDAERRWTFLRAGPGGVVVLQEDPGPWPPQHLAFTIEAADLERAAAALRDGGVEPSGPVFHAWMPGHSIYFTDPDGNALELFAPGPR